MSAEAGQAGEGKDLRADVTVAGGAQSAATAPPGRQPQDVGTGADPGERKGEVPPAGSPGSGSGYRSPYVNFPTAPWGEFAKTALEATRTLEWLEELH